MTPLVLTEKGKALLAKATDARTKYNGVTDRLLSLADTSSPQYNQDKATQLLFGEYTVAGVYVTALNEFAAFQIDGARKAGTNAVELASSSRSLVITLASVAFVLAALLALWLTRSITRPINQVVDAAKKMAVGDFNFTLKSDAKDEVGRWCRPSRPCSTPSSRCLPTPPCWSPRRWKAAWPPAPMPASTRAISARSSKASIKPSTR
jgi:methyl-accepting chemotaxis protein